MKYTIKDLTEGKCAVENNGTLEQLKEVLTKAFPGDSWVRMGIYGGCKYYYLSDSAGQWISSDTAPNKPIYPVSHFFEYGGELIGFPREVVEKMLYYQEQQTGKRDISVFERGKSISNAWGGFTWPVTPEGDTFWSRVIRDKNFDLYFEKYPKNMKNKTFSLTEKDGRSIIEVACDTWKARLIDLWAKDFLSNGHTSITKEFYNTMWDACTDSQKQLFGRIFGDHFKEAVCPYKDGEPILVKFNNIWHIRYSSGTIQDNKVSAYSNQRKGGYVSYYEEHHKLPEGFKLPLD